MSTNDKPKGKIIADDNVGNSARYDSNGNITRQDDRDKNDPDEDWDAEMSRTGRHK